MAVLRELAQHCNYGDKLTADMLVWGIADDRKQRRLLPDIGEPATAAESSGQYHEKWLTLQPLLMVPGVMVDTTTTTPGTMSNG